MPNIEKTIQWFTDKKAAGVKYSMESRRGPSSYDCSSSVYYALIKGGFFPSTIFIGNTETEFSDLEKRGWSQISNSVPRKRGDIFIWGRKGASSGAFGHTGVFVNPSDIIHCSYGYNGIHVDNHDWLWGINNKPALTIYRYGGSSQPANPVDQELDTGSMVRFGGVYKANDVQYVDGLWQVRTDEFCKDDFTWKNNGIYVEPLVEVDSDGYATADQVLKKGSLYKIPGKYRVLDIGQSNGKWLVLLDIGGYDTWVDVGPLTEILPSSSGTPRPVARPQPKRAEPAATEPAGAAETKVDTVAESAPIVKEEPAPVVEANPKEEPKQAVTEVRNKNEMNFSNKEQEELVIATQKVLDNGDFKPVISKKVKTAAYFVTDISAILSGLVLTVMAIFHLLDAVVAMTLQAAITTALLGMKQTFRLSNKEK